MHKRLVAILAIAALAVADAAFALQADDTMAAWQGASPDEKTKLVSELLRRDGYSGSPAGVISCLDAASGVPGHADLPIAKVVKACRENSGEPV